MCTNSAVRLVVRNSCKDLCGYVGGFFFSAVFSFLVPFGIECFHTIRSTRTAASNDGKALSALSSWYDGPQSWTPGSDEFLRSHESTYYAFTVFNYAIFIAMNVIAWVRYFSLRNWTYAARFLTFLAIEFVVNIMFVWRPTPDGAIQTEDFLFYYAAAPVVTYADSFISARLAWYWTILIDWWRFGGFFCCCATREDIENPDVTKTRTRYFIAFLLLGQSIVYPIITRQMYTDALICNAFMAYAVYVFIERVWIKSNKLIAVNSNDHTEQRALIIMDEPEQFVLGSDEDESDKEDNGPEVDAESLEMRAVFQAVGDMQHNEQALLERDTDVKVGTSKNV